MDSVRNIYIYAYVHGVLRDNLYYIFSFVDICVYINMHIYTNHGIRSLCDRSSLPVCKTNYYLFTLNPFACLRISYLGGVLFAANYNYLDVCIIFYFVYMFCIFCCDFIRLCTYHLRRA